MPRQNFIDELRALGFDPIDHGDGRISFPFVIPTGKFAGTEIQLGFKVGEDFSVTPPGGPHMKPGLLPLASGGTHPSGGIHPSEFGPDWQYWSRPFPRWNETNRTVKAYMAHIRHLFDTQ